MIDSIATPSSDSDLSAGRVPVDIISIQSQVVYGCVGNNAAMPVFRQAGLRAVALPTVLLSNTPYYPTLHGGIVPSEWFEGLLQGLQERGVTQDARAIVLGYLGQPAQAEALARWLPTLRGACSDLRVHIDPVMGDRNDGLYVDPGLAACYRDVLLPLADGMTPNHFELELLVGRTLNTLDEVLTAARELIARGPQWIVVTSAAPMDVVKGSMQLAVVTRDDVAIVTHPEIAIPRSVKGTGDVFMASITARLLGGATLSQAVHAACEQVTAVLQRTRERGWEELAIEE